MRAGVSEVDREQLGAAGSRSVRRAAQLVRGSENEMASYRFPTDLQPNCLITASRCYWSKPGVSLPAEPSGHWDFRRRNSSGGTRAAAHTCKYRDDERFAERRALPSYLYMPPHTRNRPQRHARRTSVIAPRLMRRLSGTPRHRPHRSPDRRPVSPWTRALHALADARA